MKQKDLLDRIDEVRANSVTPEKFKKTWGYSIDEHVADMMDRIRELEAKKVPMGKGAKVEVCLKSASIPAAAKLKATIDKIAKERITAAKRIDGLDICKMKETKVKKARLVYNSIKGLKGGDGPKSVG